MSRFLHFDFLLPSEIKNNEHFIILISVRYPSRFCRVYLLKQKEFVVFRCNRLHSIDSVDIQLKSLNFHRKSPLHRSNSRLYLDRTWANEVSNEQSRNRLAFEFLREVTELRADLRQQEYSYNVR